MSNIVKISTKELFKKYNKEKLLYLIKKFEDNQEKEFENYKDNFYEQHKTVTKKTFWGTTSEYIKSSNDVFSDLDAIFTISYERNKYVKIENTYHKIHNLISNITDTDLVPEIILENYDYNLFSIVLNNYEEGKTNDSQ